MDPRNFHQYKQSRHKDEPPIVDAPAEDDAILLQALSRFPDEPTLIDVPVDTLSLSPTVTHRKITLTTICLTAGTQMRESLNLATIADYAEAMTEGKTFPPIIVFTDGDTYWLADGFQRVRAAEDVGYVEIEAEVHPGTVRDAMLFACGANATHGERRTNQDKRKSVCTLLDDTEWSQWSDNRIAGICGVSQPFVSEVRKSLITVISDEDNTRQYVNKHGTSTTMHTRNIGKRPSGEHQREATPILRDGVAPVPDARGVDAPPSLEIFPTSASVVGSAKVQASPSACVSCYYVSPLIDEALDHLRRLVMVSASKSYHACEQALLAIRRQIPRGDDAGQGVGDA